MRALISSDEIKVFVVRKRDNVTALKIVTKGRLGFEKSRRGLKRSIKVSGDRGIPWNTPEDLEKGAEDVDWVTTIAEIWQRYLI